MAYDHALTAEHTEHPGKRFRPRSGTPQVAAAGSRLLPAQLTRAEQAFRPVGITTGS